MAITQPTGSGGVLLCRPVTELKAMEQNEALDRVLAHLTATGVHAQLIKQQVPTRCAVLLHASGERLWHPPELTIYADGGWTVAVVTIGERSGSYLVELPRVGPGNKPCGKRIEVVPADRPHRVAVLVADNAGVAA
ncbi:hypothetical protein [Nonomuraea candida]|uniref:hypothetical protein n=1 Tax=Nonomuraea candida TaxID=359159 RepID=UPI0012F80C3E|nr:hypothetical protein [Nonomuraea candida]